MIIGLFLFFKLHYHNDYLINRKHVFDYILSKYNIDYELKYNRIGKSSFFSGRWYKFTFYDVSNDFYFEISCLDKTVSDYYADAFEGHKITKYVNSLFEPKNNLNYMMRCWVLIEDDGYESDFFEEDDFGDIQCQIVYFSNRNNIDFKSIYDMYVFFAENYPRMKIYMFVTQEENRLQYEELFNYKKYKALNEMPCLYYCVINVGNCKIPNVNELKNHIEQHGKAE